MNRGGLQEPVRDGKASILVYLDPDVRMAFEVATLKNGTTMPHRLYSPGMQNPR